jgi:predicted Zn-dependent protease
MKRIVTLVVIAVALHAVPASAQFDVGKIFDYGKKALDTGKKFAEANREFNTDEEIALGDGITSGFLGAAPLVPDDNLQRYVNRVGKWIAMHSERADLPWSFGVIRGDTLNAFAMPGGTVLVSHGLVKRLGSESELAGVLAHEIAHVVKKHQLAAIQSSMSSEAWADVGKEAAGQVISRRGGGDAYGLKGKLSNAGVDLVKNGVFIRPLDRSMEYEADRLGVVLAARAGYDPYGLVAVLQMLGQAQSDDTGTSILDTHPAAGDRLGELERVLPSLDRYASQPQVEGRFRQVVGR